MFIFAVEESMTKKEKVQKVLIILYKKKKKKEKKVYINTEKKMIKVKNVFKAQKAFETVHKKNKK